jgi:hypothetical protein
MVVKKFNKAKKKKLMYFLTFFIVPILVIFFLEILLSTSYLISKSKYFENKIENYNKRIILPYEIAEIKKNYFFKNKPIKIAVFGGSSSAGWGADINFSQFIKSNILTDKDIVVHNYSRAAEPFVGFQSEILNAVISHYDVFIIYAGHNAYVSKIYSSISSSSESRILPNNQSFKNGKKKYRIIKKRIKDYTEHGLHGYLTPNKMSFRLILEKSRLYWFSYRSFIKVNSVLKIFNIKELGTELDDNTKSNKKKYEFRYYYPQSFFSLIEREAMVDDYKKTLIDIIKKLRPDQKLIVSTVLSNNLFPPHADISNENADKIDEYEKNANGAYDALLNEDYEVLDGFIDNLPYGSHKTYLQGRGCLGPSWNSKLQNSNCLNLLNTSKQIDNYPLQIIPEINTFIRGLKFKNVLISDPVTILNSSDNFEEYNSYFVDFVHPSALGHYLIANEILIKLFSDYSKPKFYSVDLCGNFTIQKKYKKFILKPNNYHRYWSKEHIRWLEGFISIYPSKYYQFFLNTFKQKTIKKINNCSIKLN